MATMIFLLIKVKYIMNTIKIIKQTVLIASISIFFASCSNKTQYINALYNQDAVITESQSAAKDMLYDNNSGILYKISNNEEFLVVDLQISSEVTQKKVLLFGLTTWIDETGKKKKNAGVKYPMGSTGFNKSSMEKMKETRGNFSQKKVQLANESNEIAIIGQKGTGDIEIVDKRYKDNVKADISFDSFGMMHYYLKVPFKKLNLTHKDLTLLNPSIGFETGHAEMSQSPGQSGGIRPGGGQGGGRQSGMKGGGGAPGSNPEMQAMMQASSFWIKNVKFNGSHKEKIVM